MRIATYNVENLFSRIRAMAGDDEAANAAVLADVAALQRLIDQPIYRTTDKTRMLQLLRKHKVLGPSGPFFLQQTRQRLVSTTGRIVANGRANWVGWIEWRREMVAAPAIENTGRVIRAVDADVLCFIEVESRPVLRRFNDTILKPAPYRHAMVIDGNDDRGIDVGIASRWPIRNMRSHVDDPDPVTKRPVFSRDCAEFQIDVPGRRTLWVLVNHFKSRGYGRQSDNDAKRLRQAERVSEILKRFNLARDWVVVAGDLNELPKSASLAPLLHRAGLRNTFDALPAGADRWTHRGDAIPSKNDQIDYLLVSAALWPRLQQVGIERRGIWSKTKKTREKYPPLPSVTGDTSSASDHALVWAELDLR
jgi:endonuclease/exonuclease/phosphatase family metal-dependent hydrolase